MLRAAVLTISDSRSQGAAVDLSGPAAAEMLRSLDLEVVEHRLVPDEIVAIRAAVRELASRAELIVTTGGTGIALRDVTPEAIRPLLRVELPGFGEIMRTGGFSKTPLSIISRGGAGIVGQTLVVMLPGSPAAVRDGLSLVGPAIKHILKFLTQGQPDCRNDAAAIS